MIRPSSTEPKSTMEIFIKNLSGDVITLVVPEDSSIQHLISLLSNLTPRPAAGFRLVYAGKHLTSSHSLSTYNITDGCTLHLASPTRSNGPPRKIRCSFKNCRDGVQRIVGDCGFCGGHFCAKHRLLEDHKCDGLEDCKRQSHERNAAQLHAERTHAIKGV
ncbi:AN1-type zinc finger protein TMC1 [Erysiphe necator]|nr:AN1-type zinc finger protein TMC1 [Erysiphe necator]